MREYRTVCSITIHTAVETLAVGHVMEAVQVLAIGTVLVDCTMLILRTNIIHTT